MHIKDKGKEAMTDIFPVNPSTFIIQKNSFKLFSHLNSKPGTHVPK